VLLLSLWSLLKGNGDLIPSNREDRLNAILIPHFKALEEVIRLLPSLTVDQQHIGHKEAKQTIHDV
jgi:hypothetical protein